MIKVCHGLHIGRCKEVVTRVVIILHRSDIVWKISKNKTHTLRHCLCMLRLIYKPTKVAIVQQTYGAQSLHRCGKCCLSVIRNVLGIGGHKSLLSLKCLQLFLVQTSGRFP